VIVRSPDRHDTLWLPDTSTAASAHRSRIAWLESPYTRVALCAALAWLAWLNRFMQDDAYIFLRYARNLASGHGLVWNVGERVEGYTSFLYTVLMAVPYRVGVDAVAAGSVVGIAFFVGSLLAVFATARHVFGSAGAAMLAVTLLGTNYTFSIFATGGLETSMHALLICVGFWLLTRGQAVGWTPMSLAALSGVLGLMLLSRPDSAIPCAVLAVAAGWRVHRARSPRPSVAFPALLAPAAAMVSVWLAWKLSYYGELLPNTYYVKVASSTSAYYGLRYLYLFVLSYWLVAAAVLVVPLARQLRTEAKDGVWASLVFVTLWLPYVVRIGGDFMEFRFLVPVLPALMLLIVTGLRALDASPAVRATLVVILVAGSVHHAFAFDAWPRGRGPESRGDLRGHLDATDQNWIGIGEALAQAAAGDDSLRIAVGPAGAIPYYSKLPAIDMIGLTDHWIARHGESFSTWPGHQRVAPYHYLVRRDVHLIIGHPVLRSSREPRIAAYSWRYFQQLALPGATAGTLPDTIRVVEMPVGESHYLPMLYIRSHAVVDGLLARGIWREARFAG